MIPIGLIKKLLVEVVKNAPKKETAMDRLAQKLIPKKEPKTKANSKDLPKDAQRMCPHCFRFRPAEEFQGARGRCSHCKDK